MHKVKISARGHTWSAFLDDSETGNRLWEGLPVTGKANRWGDEVFFSVDIDEGSEPLQETVTKGDIAFCPPESLCLFFGPTPMSKEGEIRPASPVVVVGQIQGDLELLKSVTDEDMVQIERVEQ